MSKFGFWIIEVTEQDGSGVLYAGWPSKEDAERASEDDPTIADDIGSNATVEFKYVNNIQRLNRLEVTTPDPAPGRSNVVQFGGRA